MCSQCLVLFQGWGSEAGGVCVWEGEKSFKGRVFSLVHFIRSSTPGCPIFFQTSCLSVCLPVFLSVCWFVITSHFAIIEYIYIYEYILYTESPRTKLNGRLLCNCTPSLNISSKHSSTDLDTTFIILVSSPSQMHLYNRVGKENSGGLVGGREEEESLIWVFNFHVQCDDIKSSLCTK